MSCAARQKLLCALCVFAVLPPCELAAQLPLELRGVAAGGGSWTLPVDLYDEWIRRRVRVEDPSVPGARFQETRTRYTERLDAGTEIRAALGVERGERHYAWLRGRLGSAGSVGRYQGGGDAVQALRRTVTWAGVDALAGFVFTGGDRFRASAYTGPMLTWWRLDPEGRGRDALAQRPGDSLPPPVDWSVRRWSRWGAVLGGELRYRFTDALALGISFEQRFAPAAGRALAASDQADIRRSTGREVQLVYEPYTASPRTLGVAVQWRFGRRVPVDPGPAAVRARLALPAVEPPLASNRLPDDVRAALLAGDTAAAIVALQELAPLRPRDPLVLGTLGVLLSASAPTRETAVHGRMRADELLERALRLDPGNPRYLMALGTLIEKRGQSWDARRVLRRALAAAARRPADISAAELADAFYRRARSYEVQILEFEGLRFLGPRQPPLSQQDCGAGAFCMNWERPRDFFEWFEPYPELDPLMEAERAAMLDDYGRALAVLPSHAEANRRLVAHHARREDWAGAAEAAARYHDAAPEDPWSAVYLGTALVWSGGDRERAAALFRSGVARLTAADRRVFEDLNPILSTVEGRAWTRLPPERQAAYRDVYWRRSDPLYLTPENERELEHQARVALAELLFGEPQSARRGWETDRGQILVRYGQPQTTWQIVRNDALLMRAADWNDLATEDDCLPTDVVIGFNKPGMVRGCDLAPSARGPARPSVGGRWIFWNYDPGYPSFIFDKKLGSATVRHMLASVSAAAAQDMQAYRPTTFVPPFRDAGPFTHQLARFQADAPDTFEVEIYGRAPAAALVEAPARDTITAGLFVFHRPAHGEVAAERARHPLPDGRIDFRVALPAGAYSYSLEAASPDAIAASLERGEFDVGAYATSPVRLSDLVIALAVRARVPEPRTRRDLEFRPFRCLASPADGRFALLFEAYGLTVRDGAAHYRVTIDHGAPAGGNIAVRLLRGLGQLLRGGPDDASITYERTAPTEDGRVVEWLEIEAPDRAGRALELSVTVTDLATSNDATARRTLAADAECRP